MASRYCTKRPESPVVQWASRTQGGTAVQARLSSCCCTRKNTLFIRVSLRRPEQAGPGCYEPIKSSLQSALPRRLRSSCNFGGIVPCIVGSAPRGVGRCQPHCTQEQCQHIWRNGNASERSCPLPKHLNSRTSDHHSFAANTQREASESIQTQVCDRLQVMTGEMNENE